MSTMETSGAPPSHADGGPGRAQRHRRPRRGRSNNNNAALEFRPATVAPGPQAQATVSANRGSPTPRGNSNRGRRGRGGQTNPQPSAQNRTLHGGRQFGGQLTQHEPAIPTESTAGQLQAHAPVFVPGQKAVASTQAQPKQTTQHTRRTSKSQAPDIATRTHEDIDRGHYECPICTSEVQRNSKVWSCTTCWTVFHLSCISKWAKNQGATAAQQERQNGEIPPPRQWRCPGCNLPKDDLPKMYSCWCGKETDPSRAPAGVPPHSCGQSCGNWRSCPHPCQLTCHAGPCPPCTHMGPTQTCFCGKHEITKRCAETDYNNGWSCGEICGELMPCGDHECSQECHAGLCGACDVRVRARCYCGQSEKDILCDDRGEERESRHTFVTDTGEGVEEGWTGSFECGRVCDRLLDCGMHKCTHSCHEQTAEPGHCPQSPDVVTHCPCGKTELGELTDSVRKSCADPIPHCQLACNKVLPCGHRDEQICHSGSCSTCTKIVDIQCRCARTSSKTMCHQGADESPQCPRVCRITLNCGRHECGERCCPGERAALDRQKKRKSRSLAAAPRHLNDAFEAEHICTRQCDRLLKCGTHTCTELCHKGACGTCREAIFSDVSCNCGRTVLQPPLPCGTKPPPCRFPCNRSKSCGHPQVQHNCHTDQEECPKCPYLVEKRCMCGKKTIKNQPCWRHNVSCGNVCGHKLRCGSHFCRKGCHRSGNCEDADGQPCSQPCGKLKAICDHPDMENTCHAPFPCKEDKPCQSKIFITCACQAQKQEMKCGASKTAEGNGGRTLPCTEECAKLERNRKLALALNIDQATHVEGGDHVPFSADTLTLFAEHQKWGQTQEREFRVFATSDDEKRLRFKPMQARQRAFIHHLAEDFGFDSESIDPEPNRHVFIWKTPRFVSAPNKTLTESLRVRQMQKAATASASVSDNESSKAARPANVSEKPFNSFIISSPRFGLTVDEIRAELAALIRADMPLTFDIEFLPSEDVLIKAISRTLSDDDLETMLFNIKAAVVAAIATKGFGSPELCRADNSLNIVRRESDNAAGDGWSRVAAKKAAARVLPSGNNGGGSTNAFSALGNGNKITFTKKKQVEKPKAKKEVVVDDWETAELAEEEKEKDDVGSTGDGGRGAVLPEVTEPADASEVAAGPARLSDEAGGAELHDWAAEVEESQPLS